MWSLEGGEGEKWSQPTEMNPAVAKRGGPPSLPLKLRSKKRQREGDFGAWRARREGGRGSWAPTNPLKTKYAPLHSRKFGTELSRKKKRESIEGTFKG